MVLDQSDSRHVRAELLWVGQGAWCACDSDVSPDDPQRVIAFVECRNKHVDVVWVRDRRPPDRFETLREAVRAIDNAVTARPASTAAGPR
jgi:hypothetical protein